MECSGRDNFVGDKERTIRGNKHPEQSLYKEEVTVSSIYRLTNSA
jgi:hypothetical protein